MRLIFRHPYFYSYFTTASVCIVLALAFSQQAQSSSLFEGENMFLDETKDGSDNNFFLNDDSTDSGRMEPMVDILDDESALNIALTDQIQLASSAYIDECSIYLPSPSPSRSRNRLRTRANSDSCNSPGVVAGGARGRPRNTDDSRGNEKKWCAESQVPIPGFGNVPVCYKSGIGGLESEMFLLEPTPSTGFFQNLFTCNLITPARPNACTPESVWCCNAFLEDFEYDTVLFYQELIGPPGTGYWCVIAN